MKRVLAVAVVLFAFAASADVVTVGGAAGGKTSEFVVTNSAGGSTLTAFPYRKALELQNLGPNAIYCTTDGQAPLATGALGRKVDAGATWSLQVGPAVVVKCIAATAAQVTGAATQVTELR